VRSVRPRASHKSARERTANGNLINRALQRCCAASSISFRPCGFAKFRHRGIPQETTRVPTIFALPNLLLLRQERALQRMGRLQEERRRENSYQTAETDAPNATRIVRHLSSLHSRNCQFTRTEHRNLSGFSVALRFRARNRHRLPPDEWMLTPSQTLKRIVMLRQSRPCIPAMMLGRPVRPSSG
jgi:hypothetical protein